MNPIEAAVNEYGQTIMNIQVRLANAAATNSELTEKLSQLTEQLAQANAKIAELESEKNSATPIRTERKR